MRPRLQARDELTFKAALRIGSRFLPSQQNNAFFPVSMTISRLADFF